MRAGRVRVNGEVVTELGVRVVPGRDAVDLDGVPVTVPKARWIAFHKPPGVLTTRGDPHGGRTIYDVLPPELASLRYVGRLDLDTSGLLLLTNEGDAAHGLQHPSGEVERAYEADVVGRVEQPTLARLRRGVELEDGPARAKRVDLLRASADESRVALVLTEGRKREVRRMLRAVGHEALRLRRVRFGPVELGDLPLGAWRELTSAERRALARLQGRR